MNQLHKPIDNLLASVSSEERGALSLRDLLDAESKYLKSIERYLNHSFPQSEVAYKAHSIDRNKKVLIKLISSIDDKVTFGKKRVPEAMIQIASQGNEHDIKALEQHLALAS
ncbi:hypothetical protein GT360_17635 [Vibrio astriarenae]|uniref:DH domain-containing protein n=1 Tax=Vibrio astriarenae TaxID=1481923 RepID=A0A7Z2T6R3_9VIBR|nr:hypothetical protein [Vibrio astriarenae]QIA65361.1 hypothetical protein GT360_17635 [Vibrio astriarenae]